MLLDAMVVAYAETAYFNFNGCLKYIEPNFFVVLNTSCKTDLQH